MTATASEVRAHLGVGYGAFAAAHLGRLYEEIAVPAPIVVVRRKAPTTYPQAQQTVARIIPWIPPPETLDEKLERAVLAIPAYAKKPDLQQWVSRVLTMTREDLTTDFGVAAALLSATQAIVRAPVDKVVLLAASYVAVGLPVYAVVHDDRPLTAVYVDDTWRYADPNANAELGAHLLFVRERFFFVPSLPTPEQTAVKLELEALRTEIVMVRQGLAKLQSTLALEAQRTRTWRTVAIVAVVVLVIVVLYRRPTSST